jgi:uncharacterized membrane protein
MNNKTHTVAFLGIMGALTFVVLFLETYVFTVLIPLAPPCFLSISLAITLSIFSDWKKMFVGGTLLGVCSLIIAFIIGNVVFMKPWISVLPRIFVGVVAFGVSKLTLFIVKNSSNKFLTKYLPYSLGAIFGVITNTVLVLFLMFFGSYIGIEEIIGTFMAINFPIEVVASALIVPVLVNAVKRFNKGA